MKRFWLLFLPFAWMVCVNSNAQCPGCSADPTCTSEDGFPTICPASLPSAFTGEPYEETITFFMPTEVVDPGSGLTATLNSVTVTSITGTPLGLDVELDDEDAIYYPASGQTTGCANVCGIPVLAGTFDMVISISAVASALGIEQVVTESFSYVLVVEEGEAGSSTFTYTPPSGCDTLMASFEASLAGNANQITEYAWDFGNGITASEAQVYGIEFDSAGVYNVSLQTTISDQLLTQVTLSSTAGGGWDDGWSPSPDPYFVISDSNGGNVYVSSIVNETYSNTWNNVNVILSNPPYTITFFDDDLFPEDDYLGAMSFTPDGAGTITISADPSYGELTIGLQTAIDAQDTSEVVVNVSPLVDIAWSDAGDTLTCPTPDLIAFDWYQDGNLIASGPDSAFVPLAHGWYHVIGTSAAGCSGTSDSLLFCASNATFGLGLSLGETPEVIIAEADLAAFVWTFNGIASDTLPGSEGTMWFPEFSGWYSAEGWDAYGCPWTSDSVLVCWPLNEPQIDELSGGNLAVNAEYSFYQWWLNGEPIPGATDSILMSTGPGLYAVSVTDFLDCPGVISVDWLVVDVAEWPEVAPSERSAWQIYPNPAEAYVTFQLPPTPTHWIVQAYDFNGRMVHKAAASDGSQWPLDDWPAGTYWIRALEEKTGRALSVLLLIKR